VGKYFDSYRKIRAAQKRSSEAIRQLGPHFLLDKRASRAKMPTNVHHAANVLTTGVLPRSTTILLTWPGSAHFLWISMCANDLTIEKCFDL